MAINTLTMNIRKIKGISELSFEIPVEAGIYALVGSNGCGKSTILQVLAQLIRPKNALWALRENDYTDDSDVLFQYMAQKDDWYVKKDHDRTMWRNSWYTSGSRRYDKPNNITLNGMYEGSLFVGTRFQDSRKVDQLVYSQELSEDNLVEADDYVKQKLSYILHGDYEHYKKLKRLKNKELREKLKLTSTPYFVESVYGGIISQYKMSSGECLLISLLHFIHNSIVRKSLARDIPILMLLDEIELALHPVAVSRFLDLLEELIKVNHNITVVLTTHAPEVIRRISPNNMFKLENSEGHIDIINPCYPSYAIRELYTADKYDYTILCEDELAKIFLNKIIKKHNFCASKLVCTVPVGGWENVLRLHSEILANNVLGVGTKIISILDGDIENLCKKKDEYQRLIKLFIPIPSIEKFLFEIIVNKKNKEFRKEINDKYFQLTSLDTIYAEFNAEYPDVKTHKDKIFYRYLIKDLSNRKITEEVFVESLCDDILEKIDVSKFVKSFATMLGCNL